MCKKNVNELKISWRKSLKQESLLLQLCTPHQSTVCTDYGANYYKNYFSNMLQTEVTLKLPQVSEEYILIILSSICLLLLFIIIQKQPFRGVPKKRCSENKQQIYRRTPMPKCDFNKVAKQLYWNHTSAWVFSCKFLLHVFRTPFLKISLDGCFWLSLLTAAWVLSAL